MDTLYLIQDKVDVRMLKEKKQILEEQHQGGKGEKFVKSEPGRSRKNSGQ